nr:hypothetical protein GCM10025699_26510 [Microbacterium flavescens]
MRAAAEVLPDGLAVAVDVVVDRQLAGADLDRGALGGFLRPALESDQLELERLVDQLHAGFFVRHHPAHEALAFTDDALHLLVDGLHIFGGERMLDPEVVVEAVGDRRPDAEVGLRVDALDGLGEDMRCGVPQDVQPVGAVDGDGLDLIGILDTRGEVFELAVHAEGDHRAVGEEGEAVGGV